VIEAELRKGWIPKKLNELGFVGRGKSRHRPRNDPKLYGGSYPFVQTADIMNSDLYITSFSQTYNETGLAQSKLWNENTLCMTIAGANTAETALLSFKACFPDSVIGFIADPDKSDVRFVKYYLDTIKQQLKSVARGTTQHNLPLEKLLSFDIYTPPLPTQRKIAAILSAYDDLIENNTRRIAILEEMAQALYREWFVHFRYPGHEGVRMVESELGPVPEGWEVCRFSDVVRINPPINVDKEEEKPYVEMAGLSTNSMVIESKETRTGRSGAKFENGDTLFPRITPSVENGKGGFVQFLPDRKVGLGSTEFIVFRSIELCPEYVYLLSRTYDFRENAIKSMIGASGRQRVQNECFDNYWLAKPPEQILNMFSGIVSPSFRIIQVLVDKNANLRQTRDLLLPRLISGELDVSRLEVDTEGLGA
jgi:type I restriction enzyme S subunit